MFGGDFLHQLIVKPGIEPVHHRRIATERPITERIDLMKLKLHDTAPFSRSPSMKPWTTLHQ
jgi:hypothetical protein